MRTKTAIFIACFLLLTTAAHTFNLDSFLVESVGGQKALERIKSLKSYRMTGRINWSGLEGSYEGLFQAPNRIKVTADFETFSIVQGFDGTNSWQKDLHGRVFELAGFEKTEFMRTVYFMTFAYLVPGRMTGSYELCPPVHDDSARGVIVNFYPLLNDTVRTQFDLETGLPICQFSRLDNLEVRNKIEDYRNVEAVLVPFHTSSVAEGTPILTEVLLDSVAFDIDVDDAQFTKPEIELNDFHFPADSTSVTIPFKFSNGHVIVFIEVNGIKQGWFILDSGASATYYDTKFVGDLELVSAGKIPSMGLGGFENIQLVRVDSLNIGRLTLYNQTAGVLPLDQLAAQVQEKTAFGGLLGYDFFMRFPVLFDFKKQKLTVFNPSNFVLPENGVTLPFHLSMMIPTVTAVLNGISGNFLIDLGNSLGLIINQHFGEQLAGPSAGDSGAIIERTLAGVGQGVAGRTIQVESLQIGAHKLYISEAILAESSDGLTGSWEIAGNIGTEVLQQYAVLFDYPNSRIVFYDLAHPTE